MLRTAILVALLTSGCAGQSGAETTLAFSMILGTMLLADPAVRFMLGPGYQGSVAVFKILAWATVPSFLNYALNIFLLARNREWVFLRTASVCTVVNVAANLLLIPRYSYIAAAAVTYLGDWAWSFPVVLAAVAVALR